MQFPGPFGNTIFFVFCASGGRGGGTKDFQNETIFTLFPILDESLDLRTGEASLLEPSIGESHYLMFLLEAS